MMFRRSGDTNAERLRNDVATVASRLALAVLGSCAILELAEWDCSHSPGSGPVPDLSTLADSGIQIQLKATIYRSTWTMMRPPSCHGIGHVDPNLARRPADLLAHPSVITHALKGRYPVSRNGFGE